ncbi:MAG: hypothetical protein CVU62_13820, partial [Deltaproteobacteria bacterium HGW-Deltaproteobacteria-2]
VTVTDDKGATDTQDVTITITGTNDAPTLQAITGGQVYEAGLSPSGTAPSATTILANGTLTYGDIDTSATSLSIVVDGGTGHAFTTGNLTGIATDVIGTYTDASHYGTIVFHGDGSWEYTLTAPIDNNSPSAPLGTTGLQGPDSFQVQIYDGQDYSASQTLTINVLDDSPLAFTPDGAMLNNQDGTTFTGNLDLDNNIDNNIGADQTGTVQFLPSLNGADSGLTSGTLPITYVISGGGQILTGVTTAQPAGVFTITLNQNVNVAGTDQYTVHMIGTVDGGAEQIIFNGASGFTFVGGNGAWAGYMTPAADDSQDLLLTPMEYGVSSGTINETAHSMGVSGGASVGEHEALRLDFVQDLMNVGPIASGKSYSDPTYQNHTFDSHYLADGAAATFLTKSSTTIRIKAFDDDDSGTNKYKVGDGVQDSVTAFAITYGGMTELINFADTSSHTVEVGGHTFNYQFVDGAAAGTQYEVLVDIVNGTQIATFTADGYNSLEYHWESGGTFQVGDFGTSSIDPGKPVDISVPVEIVDADGDTAPGTIDVLLAPENSLTPQDYSSSPDGVTAESTLAQPNIIGSDHNDTLTGDSHDNILYGGAGDDHLIGNEGNDLLVGGTGNDSLEGGAGNDILIGGLGDDTLTGSAGADTFKTGQGNDLITDYKTTDGDKVDISAVLNITDHTEALAHLEVDNTAKVLNIYDSSNPLEHTTDHLVGSVTFDSSVDMNALLGDLIHHT